MPNLRAEHTLTDALDWCCLHLPEAALPPAFKLSRVGEAAADDDPSAGQQGHSGQGGAKALSRPTIPSAKPMSTKEREKEMARAAEARAQERLAAAKARVEAAAKAKAPPPQADGGEEVDFTRRYVAAMMDGVCAHMPRTPEARHTPPKPPGTHPKPPRTPEAARHTPEAARPLHLTCLSVRVWVRVWVHAGKLRGGGGAH